MHHSKDPLFQILFNQLAEARLILKAEFPNFIVISSNSAWQNQSGTDKLYPGLNMDDLFLQVIEKGEALVLQPVLDNHSDKDTWFELEILPIKDISGDSTTYLMCTLYDVTERVNGEHALTASKVASAGLLLNNQELNEELATSNEELAAANEELTAVNEELLSAQERLRLLNNDLELLVQQRTLDLQHSEQKARFIVEDAPVAIGVLEGRNLIIDSANKKMLEIWGKDESVIGKTLREGLPELEGQAFLGILDDIFVTGSVFYGNEVMAVLEYSGILKEGYFNFVYQPVKDELGRTLSIMVVATEVTEQVKARKVIEESAHQLRRMVMTTPIGLTILKGTELSIEIANQPMLDIWGRRDEEVIGRNLTNVFPELADQPFPALLRNIFDTGKRVAEPSAKATIVLSDGTFKEIYVDFSYDPLFDLDGNVEAILASVKDVTELTEGRKMLQQRQEELETLNEEFLAANEELVATNDELFETQEDLKLLFERLKDNETRFRSLFEQSPVGMCFLKGEELIIELANENILKIWGRTREEVVGKPHALARPELRGQPMNEWLREVYVTGIPRINNELKVKLYDKGGLREAFVHSLYHPLKDEQGVVTGLLIILSDVTPWVQTRKQVEWAQEQLSQAIQSAELGTWYIKTETREFIPSQRLKELFGFQKDEVMTFADAIKLITDDYRESVVKAIEDTIENGSRFELEYPIHSYRDGQLRWLRSTGKLYPAESGTASHFSGTVLDITAHKLEEIRKNDFIAIVSHELKTPLTSLKGYLQLMRGRFDSSAAHSFFSTVSEKSLAQVEKMHSLVKGFLDVARLESAKLVLNLQPMRIDQLVLESAEEASLMYDQHEIIVEYCEPVEVMADRDKITQVLGNLLSNAIKYSPRGKIVSMSCKVIGTEVLVEVKDQGMGIKQHEISKVFDRFYRVETKHTTTISGFGIGLYLCAEIIKLHNGRIWVESKIGVGSSFFFSLPIGKVSP
ncbi:PAS domain S-box protein [Pedobacter heparinus]|uniref:histidine kinase n=1 Tax=Pedobacter heparinus (strain ATCC 13125 / DSM 2366 / CIP 104194 / JCM 7457 / NBRC 12017 / NCIMB 9290 / NRRL B-14731 / HIM 762-3) TaxID=485917 RepID=C6XUR2_PEDHD|nr:PAS domain S-box protein [Pedobacter heparinus]ACU03912.1 PAS sensor protein [Pedobacter heparinus DSM 2366]